MEILLVLVFVAYAAVPVSLIGGWIKWARRPRQVGMLPKFSLIGFLLGSGSALLAIIAIAFAQYRRLSYHNPMLLMVFGIGAVISLSGIVFAMIGTLKPNIIRWHALIRFAPMALK